MSPTVKITQAPMRLVPVRCWQQPVTRPASALSNKLSSNLEQPR